MVKGLERENGAVEIADSSECLPVDWRTWREAPLTVS